MQPTITRPATNGQRALIASLGRRLSIHQEPDPCLTEAAASDRITALCAQVRRLPAAWPVEMAWRPTDEELEDERRYWKTVDRVAEYDAWTEAQAELQDFSTWPLADLIDELETVRTLTPDQEDILEELVAEIERRRAA